MCAYISGCLLCWSMSSYSDGLEEWSFEAGILASSDGWDVGCSGMVLPYYESGLTVSVSSKCGMFADVESAAGGAVVL